MLSTLTVVFSSLVSPLKATLAGFLNIAAGAACYTILYYTILYYTILNYTIPYYTIFQD